MRPEHGRAGHGAGADTSPALEHADAFEEWKGGFGAEEKIVELLVDLGRGVKEALAG